MLLPLPVGRLLNGRVLALAFSWLVHALAFSCVVLALMSLTLANGSTSQRPRINMTSAPLLAHSSAIEISSFISGEPTSYFLQAIEDSEILFLPKVELNKLYHAYPKMQEMMKNFLEDVVLNLINRFTSLQRDTAEKRYLDLLSKPAYFQKIPQKYLASFIGVTPTSLSRIRKKIR